MRRVQLRVEEKLSLSCGRDGGLHNMEIHGFLTLVITDETYGRVRIQVSLYASNTISRIPTDMENLEKIDLEFHNWSVEIREIELEFIEFKPIFWPS